MYCVFKFYSTDSFTVNSGKQMVTSLELCSITAVQKFGWPWESSKVLFKNRFLALTLQKCGLHICILYSPLGRSECVRLGNQWSRLKSTSWQNYPQSHYWILVLHHWGSVTIWTLKSRVHSLNSWWYSIKM